MVSERRSHEDRDRHGFDENTNPVVDVLARLVPQRLARAGLAVSVETDRDRYAVGDPVELRVVLANRLPVPVSVETPTRRLWGWSVDGELEASDEATGLRGGHGTLSFRGRERKVVTPTWNGLLKRVGEERARWVEPTPGTYEIAAFIALPGKRPRATTEIELY